MAGHGQEQWHAHDRAQGKREVFPFGDIDCGAHWLRHDLGRMRQHHLNVHKQQGSRAGLLRDGKLHAWLLDAGCDVNRFTGLLRAGAAVASFSRLGLPNSACPAPLAHPYSQIRLHCGHTHPLSLIWAG